ncbi:MAG TPA: hypothetical protein VMG10_18890 [Gemmataceae bacterium]|nr:hypothetical protein [Gemmataceae bacterium]
MDPAQLAENRRQLAQLARQKSKRRVPVELPCTWQPRSVINPEDNQPFTLAGAWEFMARLLEDMEGQSVEVLTLDNPAGKTAYVMKCDLPTGALYIKIHYGPPGTSILGRSFHYSEH